MNHVFINDIVKSAQIVQKKKSFKYLNMFF